MDRIRRFVERWFPQGQFARSVSVLAGGTALSQGLAVLAAPVLTRLYRAEDFGYFQVYMSFMAFAILAVTLRYELAIFLPDQEEVAANLVAVTLSAVLMVSAMCGAAAWLAARRHILPPIAAGLRPYLWLVPLSMCGGGIYQTLSVWALRQKAYSRVTTTKVTQVLSMLSLQTIAGFLSKGPFGLLLGDAVGRANGSLGLARLSWSRSREVFRSIRWKTMWSAATRYRRFPLISTGSSMISVAGYALPLLVLGEFYGAKTLGWLALGDRVVGAPGLLIGQAVSQVYSVEASSFSVSNPAAMHSLFLRLMKRLLILGFIPFVVFFFISPSLFAFVFGEAWREAGTYARLLALMHYVAFVAWPFTPTLNLLEQQFWQLAWDVGRLLLALGSIWFAHHWGYSARWAVGAFGAALLLAYAVHLLLSHRAIRKKIEQFALDGSQTTTLSGLAEVGRK